MKDFREEVTKGKERIENEEVKEVESYYIIKVHEHLTTNAPILIATVSTNYAKAKKTFELMRSKFPVLNPKNYTIIDVFNMDDPVDYQRLITIHGAFGEVLFIINKTVIGTYIPIEFKKPIAEIDFVKNNLCICNLVNKKNSKALKESIDKIEKTIQMNYLTKKTEDMIYVNEQQGDESVINRLNAGDEIVFIISDKTINDTILFIKHIYDITKKEEFPSGKISFMYYIDEINELYYIDIDEKFTLRKVDYSM